MNDGICCGTCKYRKPDKENGGWVCVNEMADAYCYETDYKDVCEDYEER